MPHTSVLGVWSVWTLAQTRVGDEPIFAAVTVRVRFFFAVTFSVNVLCAGMFMVSNVLEVGVHSDSSWYRSHLLEDLARALTISS